MSIDDDILEPVINQMYRMAMDMTADEVCKRYIHLDTCKASIPAKACKPKYCGPMACQNIPSAKEDQMTTIQVTEDRVVRESKQYLESRLWSVTRKKDEAAEEKFFINDMAAPNTPKELAARIAAGMFVVKNLDKSPDQEFRYGWESSAIKWRDPSKPADRASYTAFQAKLSAAKQPVEDAIAILPASDALKLLQAFETTDLLAN